MHGYIKHGNIPILHGYIKHQISELVATTVFCLHQICVLVAATVF